MVKREDPDIQDLTSFDIYKLISISKSWLVLDAKKGTDHEVMADQDCKGIPCLSFNLLIQLVLSGTNLVGAGTSVNFSSGSNDKIKGLADIQWFPHDNILFIVSNSSGGKNTGDAVQPRPKRTGVAKTGKWKLKTYFVCLGSNC